MSDGELLGSSVLVLSADAGPLNAQMAAAEARVARASRSMESNVSRRVNRAFKLTAGTAAAAVAASASLAIGFDKSMRNVNSLAGLNERQFDALEQRVLKLAGPTAQAPQTLAEGLYDLESSGFKANAAMTVLNASARAATAGLTDTATSTKAVAAVLNAYHRPASAAKAVSDDLFQTVNLGVISFENLSSVIGYVLPTAASLGVGLKSVGAAIATLTKQGQSGDNAVTNVNAALTALIKPTKDMTTTLHGLGYENAQQIIQAKGFEGALLQIVGATDGTKEAIGKLFPNVRAMRAVFALTGANTRSAAADLRSFQHDTGATSKVLAEQSKSISFQWNRLKAEASVLGIEVGDHLLPAFSELLKILENPHLTGEEKLDRLSQALGRLLSHGLNEGVHLAEQAGPKIASALAHGIVTSWGQMTPIAKLFTAAALIRAIGGPGALTRTGLTLGRGLGGGVAQGIIEAETKAIAASSSIDILAASGGARAAVPGMLGFTPQALKRLGTRPTVTLGARELESRAASIATPEAFAAAFGGIAGARYAMPVSQLGETSAKGFAARFSSTLGRILPASLLDSPLVRGGVFGTVGIALADDVMDEFSRRADARSDDLLTALSAKSSRNFGQKMLTKVGTAFPGISGPFEDLGWTKEQRAASQLYEVQSALTDGRRRYTDLQVTGLAQTAREVDLTRQEEASWDRTMRILRESAALKVGVDLKMDPHQLDELDHGLRALKSGAVTQLGDIEKVAKRNMALIASTIGTDTKQGRKLAAENMRAMADAMRASMKRSGDYTKSGMARIDRILRNADLIDPTKKQAEGFGKAWASGMDTAKEVTKKKIKDLIAEAQKMPGPMRKVALDVWLDQITEARRGGKLTQKEYRTMVSAVVSQFTGLESSVKKTTPKVTQATADMVNEIVTGFGVLGSDTNKVLNAFGPVKPYDFNLKTYKPGAVQHRQTGGMLVQGSGSGDKVPLHAMVEPGERVFVLNRNASAQLHQLQAWNRAVPRFQTGGSMTAMIGAANQVDAAHLPYLWGGGHQATPAPFGPFDCSGAVSYVLQHGGINIPTMVSGALANAGLPGPGSVTVFANAVHTFMKLGDRFFGTSGSNPGGGAGWFPPPSAGYLAGFTRRHFAAAGTDLPKVALVGPDGPLRAIGQGALDAVRHAALAHIQQVIATPIGSGDAQQTAIGAGGSYNRQALISLWDSAGGSRAAANIAAAVALAESAGNPGAINHNSNGTIDRGLWQINSIWGNLSTLDPAANARAAIEISHNGANWSPWVTYNTGAYEQFLARGGLLAHLAGGGSPNGGAQVPGGSYLPKGTTLSSVLTQIGKLRQNGSAGRVKARRQRLKRISNKLKATGLPASLVNDIASLEGLQQTQDQYATNASSLDTTKTVTLADGSTQDQYVAGLFAGHGAAYWLSGSEDPTKPGTGGELDTLLQLRNRYVQAHTTYTTLIAQVNSKITETRKRIARLIKEIAATRKRLEKLNKQIRPTARKIANLNDRRGKILHQLHDPSVKGGQRRHFQREFTHVNNQIATLGNTLNGPHGLLTQRRATASRLDLLRTSRTGQQQVLKTLQDKLGTTGGDGLLGGDSSTLDSLRTLQGLGFDEQHQLRALPGLGGLGGDIFNVQSTLAQLGQQAKPSDPNTSDAGASAAVGQGQSDLDALTIQAQQDALLRLGVQQAQAPLFAQLLAQLPKYHTGGILGGGQLGDERLYVGRVGEGVFTQDQMAAMAPASARPSVEVHNHFADGMEWLERFIDTRIVDRNRQIVSTARRRHQGV